MDLRLCNDVIYRKPWGKHKNGYYELVYNSGSYATLKRFKDGKLDTEKSIEIRCKDGSYDDAKYAQENGYTFWDAIE